MAIYHLHVKTGSRHSGQSAEAKADYITREGKYARDHAEVEHVEDGNMPAWAKDNPRQYWQAADEHERANGRLFREVEFALPVELGRHEQVKLARRFAQDLTGEERLPYTLAIHRGESRDPGKPDNPHCHLMISERSNDGIERSAATWFKRYNAPEPEKGGARKSIATKSREWLEDTRAAWAERANEGLLRSGSGDQIHEGSLERQYREAVEAGTTARRSGLRAASRGSTSDRPTSPGPSAARTWSGSRRVRAIWKRRSSATASAAVGWSTSSSRSASRSRSSSNGSRRGRGKCWDAGRRTMWAGAGRQGLSYATAPGVLILLPSKPSIPPAEQLQLVE